MSVTVPLYGFGGAGAALNFKVVPGLTQPSTVSENAIWVKTEKIGAWYFSATQPENMVEGELWFPVGDTSNVAFNALRKNTIQLRPTFPKQYVSGVLVDVPAMVYQNGEWIDLNPWSGELYDSGDEFESVTGGWQARSIGVINSNGTKPSVTRNADNIVITHNTYATGAAFEIAKDIDVSDFKSLEVTLGIDHGSGFVGVIVYDRSITQTGSSYSAPFSYTIAYESYDNSYSGTAKVDVSGINKKVCIGIASYMAIAGTTNKVTMKKARLKRGDS